MFILDPGSRAQEGLNTVSRIRIFKTEFINNLIIFLVVTDTKISEIRFGMFNPNPVFGFRV
jgi:hypothetical protein